VKLPIKPNCKFENSPEKYKKVDSKENIHQHMTENNRITLILPAQMIYPQDSIPQ